MNTLKFIPFPLLKTGRLMLRQALPGDSAAIFDLRNDETVNQFISRTVQTNEKEILDFIEQLTANIQTGRSVYWVICLRESNTLIGTICLRNFSDDEGTAEMGYELFPAWQGKGLAGEAARAVLDFGFSFCALEKIGAWTHWRNQRSIQLLKKLGFSEVTGKKDPEDSHVLFFENAANA